MSQKSNYWFVSILQRPETTHSTHGREMLHYSKCFEYRMTRCITRVLYVERFGFLLSFGSSVLLRSILGDCVILSAMATEEIFDVIVIGAGVEGSATAYHLTKLAKEKRIALVEQVGS